MYRRRSIMRIRIPQNDATKSLACNMCEDIRDAGVAVPRPTCPASPVLRSELRKSSRRRCIASPLQQYHLYLTLASCRSRNQLQEDGFSRRRGLHASRHESQCRHVRAGAANGESSMCDPVSSMQLRWNRIACREGVAGYTRLSDNVFGESWLTFE